MAKGQVTDDELATGLKSFGGFGALGGASERPRRDDPFRDTRAETAVPFATRPEPSPVELVKSVERQEREGEINAPVPLISPSRAKSREKTPSVTRASSPVKSAKAISPKRETETVRENKTERYTERVTVLLDPELRDGAESLAKELQRKRTEKGERITANTVIRVALRAMLEKFEAGEVVVNTEEELFEVVGEHLFKR